MVSIDELNDDEEYNDLKEDVEEECKRFGTVVALEIPRPKVCYRLIRFGPSRTKLTCRLLLSLIGWRPSCWRGQYLCPFPGQSASHGSLEGPLKPLSTIDTVVTEY